MNILDAIKNEDIDLVREYATSCNLDAIDILLLEIYQLNSHYDPPIQYDPPILAGFKFVAHLPLCLAMKKNNLDIARVLLENGATPNYLNCSVEDIPIEKRKMSLFDYYTMNNRSTKDYEIPNDKMDVLLGMPDMPGYVRKIICSPFHQIVNPKNNLTNPIDWLQLYLEFGADIDNLTNYGHTILHFAVEFSDANVVMFLLENGADPNIKSTNGTPLMRCCSPYSQNGKRRDHKYRENHYQIVKNLLDYGADANGGTEGQNGPLPIHLEKDPQVIKELIKQGGEINRKQLYWGHYYYPLDDAIMCGNIEKIQILIEEGHTLDIVLGNILVKEPLMIPISQGEYMYVDDHIDGFYEIVDEALKKRAARYFEIMRAVKCEAVKLI